MPEQDATSLAESEAPIPFTLRFAESPQKTFSIGMSQQTPIGLTDTSTWDYTHDD